MHSFLTGLFVSNIFREKNHYGQIVLQLRIANASSKLTMNGLCIRIDMITNTHVIIVTVIIRACLC